MPTITKTGTYHVSPGWDQGGYYAEKVNFSGSEHAVFTYISDPKIDKHNLGSYWPQQQGNLHTSITIDEDQFGPLYQLFGRDLAAACRAGGDANTWVELQYDAKELPSQHFSGNVGTRNFNQVQSLKMGGSVLFKPGVGYIVFVNHGPY